MFEALDLALSKKDSEALQDAIFDLGSLRDERGQVPDEVSFKVIDALRQDGMFTSALAGHLLNHFEFHAPNLSSRAKDRCIGFLQTWGDRFAHVHSQQVVAELRSGTYLK